MNKIFTGKTKYFLLLIFVVALWGVYPIFCNNILQKWYSPAFRTGIDSLIGVIVLLIIFCKKLKLLNKRYFIVAVPTGIFYSAACVMQQVGLSMTTPTMYSFLENLSCVIVPILAWALTRKRPPVFKFIAAGLCLVSAYFLCAGGSGLGSGFGLGEILCGLAGIFYGVNIAVTGEKAKDLHPGLYLLIQFSIQTVVGIGSALICEDIYFSFEVPALASLVGGALGFILLGWFIRTICLKHLDSSLVAVVMPFSSVIATVISILLGLDTLSTYLIIGAVLGVVSAILSDFDFKKFIDRFRKKKEKQVTENLEIDDNNDNEKLQI